MDLTPPLDPGLLEQSFTLFRLSRVVYAAAELRLADHLALGSRTAAELAELTNTHAPTLGSLMEVLVGWGLFAREGERYSLTDASRRLVPGSENAVNVPLMLGWAGFPAMYEAFGDIMHTLRTGETAFKARYGTDFHGYLVQHPEMRELYDRAMDSTTHSFKLGAEMLDLSGVQRIVDVGGGQGALLLEILERHPHVRGTSFDLPDVIREATPSHPRLELVGGSALESVPAGADVYVTSTVLRCFDDENCLRLLKNIHAAMPEHGRLAAFEMLIPAERDHLGHATADLVARVVYGGQDRTEEEFKRLFEQAGLRHVNTRPKGGGIWLMEAAPA